jgi:hypothetical protein
MNILRILLLLFGTTNLIYSKDLEIVKRRIQSSMNYGSASQNNYQGSGVESKQTTSSYKGSMKYGSTAIKQHGSSATQNHGSIATRQYGSTTMHHYGSSKHGSSATHHYGSTAIRQHGSISTQNHGSTAMRQRTSHKGSYKYNSGTHGSGTHGSGTHYSGTHKGSNTKYMSAYVFSAIKGSGSKGSGAKTKGSGPNKYSAPSPSNIYNAFAPTYHPTEQLPEVYQPPPPTFYPTVTMTVPEIPGLSKILNHPTDDITIPPLSLSFQIKQGGNGWSSYPDPPAVLTSAVSRVTGINKKYITNLRLSTQSNRRKLSSQFYFYYNITIPIQDATPDKNNQEKIYTAIVYILQYSVLSGAFTDYFKNISLPINITSIAASPYIIVYSAKPVVQSTTIESNNNNKSDPTLIYFYIVFGTLLSVGGISTVAYFVYKKRNMKNNAIKFRDSIPNPIQKQIQLTNQ